MITTHHIIIIHFNPLIIHTHDAYNQLIAVPFHRVGSAVLLIEDHKTKCLNNLHIETCTLLSLLVDL